MVDVMGHIAFGLLFAVPAWFVWGGRVSIVFIALTTTTAMLPDVDLVLSNVFPQTISHHGITHTLLFVTAVSIVVGALVTPILRKRIDSLTRGDRFDSKSLFLFVTGAFTLGGASHLFADMLSAPDIAPPVNPFWPFFAKPWSVNVLYYNSIWANAVLLATAVVLHLGLWYVLDPFDHRYRIETAKTPE